MFGLLPQLTIDDWFEIFMTPGQLATEWAKHTAGYWKWRRLHNVLALTYGEIKREPRRSIARVAATMKVDLTTDELNAVEERSTFAYMKTHESQFAPPRRPFTREANRPRMIRRGEAGASHELLSPDQREAVDRVCRAELERLGSDFPYASAFDVEEA